MKLPQMNSPQSLPRQLVTIEEIAPFIGCSVRHVRNLRNQRLIPYVPLGRLIRYNPEKVMEAIEKLTVKEQGAEPAPIPRSYRRMQ